MVSSSPVSLTQPLAGNSESLRPEVTLRSKTALGILFDVSERDHQSRRPGGWASWGNYPQKLIYVDQIISLELANPTNQHTSMSIYPLTKTLSAIQDAPPGKPKVTRKKSGEYKIRSKQVSIFFGHVIWASVRCEVCIS